MDYNGHVEPGAGPATRHLPNCTIMKLSVGPMDNNTYLLRNDTSGTQLLIDAAAEPERILDLVGPGGLTAIVTTHSHQDHWGALAHVQEATGAQTFAHKTDAGAIGPRTDSELQDGQIIRFGGIQLCVTHLRGHTDGSIALAYLDPEGPPHLFTGDSLFPGGVGMTHNPDEFTTLLGDVTEKLFDRFPDATWVYPGHGDDTTIGRERPQLAQWRDRGW